jgi:hypothetical protein
MPTHADLSRNALPETAQAQRIDVITRIAARTDGQRPIQLQRQRARTGTTITVTASRIATILTARAEHVSNAHFLPASITVLAQTQTADVRAARTAITTMVGVTTATRGRRLTTAPRLIRNSRTTGTIAAVATAARTL